MNALFCLEVDCSQILCRAFKLKEFDFAIRFLYMVWIKSDLHGNADVEISG